MTKKIKNRNEVNLKDTWDLGSLFENDADFKIALIELKENAITFANQYKGELNNSKIINQALDDYKIILEKMTAVGTYQALHLNTNQQDEDNLNRSGEYQIAASNLNNILGFFETELMTVEDVILAKAASENKENQKYIEKKIKEKQHALSPEVNQAITALGSVLGAPYTMYNRSKLADIDFPNFEVNGESYPMSFVSYENEFEYENHDEIRREAFNHFHKELGKYQNTFAAIYQNQVTKEKVFADLKGFDSVFDYLLFDQEVSVEMYDRQIDLIMDHLAPHMRKYAKLLQRIHGLDTMTYADLKLSVDPEFEPEISIEESQQYLLDGLEVLGEDYLNMVKMSFKDRWIDFPQNKGKSTGAFCSSPYGNHPYILINWTKRMREVFVLAHEVGHAGHFYLAGQHQNILNVRPSLYFIEAPSTMNELLMANYLKNTSQDDRFKRWVLSSMISRTYYHNFVTHLLEAAFQREVYRLVDKGEALSTARLNTIKKSVIQEFWGEDIVINDEAKLTWMRQPHYYMGLYPYTYSAGLTIATQASQKVINNDISIEQWLDVLKAGGSKTPLELAKMVNVDLETEQPLLDTIDFIGNMINEIIELTDKIEA